MTKCDLIIENGTIVTVDPVNTIIDNGFVAVKNDSIIAVSPETERNNFRAEEIVDADNGIIMPGLVNAHCHTPMSLFRGLADDLPLMTWLNDYMFKAEAKYINPENTLLGATLSCIEMLLSGTTLVCDGYFHEEMVVEAVLKTGIKGVLGHGIIDFPAPGVPDPSKNVAHAADYVDRFKAKSTSIYPSIFCHSPYTCSAKTLKSAKKAASEAGVLFQTHVSETRGENEQMKAETGMTPVRFLYENDILDQKTLLVHSVWIDDADMELIRASGASVAHCPESNMKLGSGIAPVTRLIEKGIPVGLGTDGSASNNNLDLFSEMDTAAKLQKAAQLDPSVADALTVLKMATINGAGAIGLGEVTGSLEVGKKADIIVLDTNKPHLTPVYNPVSHIVYSASGSDVRDVVIDGKIIIREGSHRSIDVSGLIKEVKAFAEKVNLKGS